MFCPIPVPFAPHVLWPLFLLKLRHRVSYEGAAHTLKPRLTPRRLLYSRRHLPTQYVTPTSTPQHVYQVVIDAANELTSGDLIAWDSLVAILTVCSSSRYCCWWNTSWHCIQWLWQICIWYILFLPHMSVCLPLKFNCAKCGASESLKLTKKLPQLLGMFLHKF
jgi:hypothetical protein